MIQYMQSAHNSAWHVVNIQNLVDFKNQFGIYFGTYVKQISFFFFFLVAPCGVWDLSSQTRDQTRAPPTVKALSLNPWMAK